MQNDSKSATWSARLAEQAESGLSIGSWCALEGVTEAAFHYWRRRLRDSKPAATQLIGFPLAAPEAGPALEVETPQGYVIRLGSQCQIGWLGAVLEALR